MSNKEAINEEELRELVRILLDVLARLDDLGEDVAAAHLSFVLDLLQDPER